jgi:hypothetical protein
METHYSVGDIETRVLAALRAAGLAGPARMLAATPGCHVECIDLSPDYCVAAALLNRLTGLEDRVAVKIGSALDIPYAADSSLQGRVQGEMRNPLVQPDLPANWSCLRQAGYQQR